MTAPAFATMTPGMRRNPAIYGFRNSIDASAPTTAP